MYYVYTLRCADRSLYTGITTDVPRRMRQHLGQLAGGAKYTALRRPVSLVMLWQAPDRSAASRLEAAVKRLAKPEKERLVTSPALLPELCPGLEAAVYTALPGTPYSLK